MNPREFSEASSSRNPDRLRAYAGLLQDVSTLIAELEANKAANQAEATFSFEIIGDNTIMIPEAVRKEIPNLDQITVTIGKDSDEDPSYLSINFLSDDKSIIISRSGLEAQDDTPDVTIDTSLRRRADVAPDGAAYSSLYADHQLQNEQPNDFHERISDLKKVPLAELNALIMSMIHPNDDHLYAQYDEVNFLTPAAHESLRESFELAALNNRNNVNYTFETSDATFNFFKREGQPISFEVSYLDKKSEQKISAQSDLETDFKIVFSTLEPTEENPYFPGQMEFVRSPYFPSTEEIYYLLAILKTEIAAINPTTLMPIDIEVVDENSPETQLLQKGTEVFSQAYVRNVLEQLGLDAPDAGTA